ncbi:MAG TPA: hypothetical protein VGN20_10940 [Mucilaginibacter sp.]|jgi:hypothetical protein
MKLKLKIFLILFAGIAIAYTACKKSSTPPPSDSMLTPDVVAGQLATTLNQSLFGGLGAFDVSSGLSAPSTIGMHNSSLSGGLKLTSGFSQPLNAKMTGSFASNVTCGLAIDTTVSVTDSSNGTTATITGSMKFNYVCSNSQVSGFTTNDKLTIVLASPSLNLSYKVGEIVTLTSSNPADPNANISLSGSLNSDGSYQYNTGTKKSGTSTFDYTLTSLVISPVLGDIVSGNATFNTSGTGPKGVWNYQGTIVFSGNHSATVTISGKAYHVNLQTGVVN